MTMMTTMSDERLLAATHRRFDHKVCKVQPDDRETNEKKQQHFFFTERRTNHTLSSICRLRIFFIVFEQPVIFFFKLNCNEPIDRGILMGK